MAVLTYRKAIAESIARVMRTDDRVVFLGEDVGRAGGAFKSTVGLLEEFGPSRVWDTPISEQAIIGAAIGAAMTGLLPIAEIMFADFLGTCWDGIANHAAKLRYMSGGGLQVPLVVRTHGGAGAGFGAQHSQTWENLLMAVPGLKVVVPSTPSDVVGLLRSAIEDPDPVVIVENKTLFDIKAEVPDDPEYRIQLGEASLVRQGADVTLVALGSAVKVASEAAASLEARGVSAEVIDLRTLVPLDFEAVTRSVTKTARLVLVEDGPRSCGWGAEVSSLVAQEAFYSLDAPIQRVTAAPTPVPFARSLEQAWLPTAMRVEKAVLECF
jgi:pyruvate dehydrogenase E1 component beta subunit